MAEQSLASLKVDSATHKVVLEIAEESGLSVQEAATRAMEAGIPILKEALRPLIEMRKKAATA
jgi:hypothetical protein